MFKRITRLWRAPKRAASRLGRAEAQLTIVSQQLAALEGRLTTAVEREMPGLLILAEHNRERLINDAMLATLRRAESHVNAAVDAASTIALNQAYDFAVNAVETAQAHTNAATAVAMTEAVRAAREHAEASADASQRAAIDAAREHAEVLSHQTVDALKSEVAAMRRELMSRQRTSVTEPRATPTSPGEATRIIDPSLYVALEDAFRGDPAEIERRQRRYLPYVADLADDQHPIIDLGSGRGEWLHILAEAGVASRGVDSNPAFVAESREAGLNVIHEDLVAHLFSAPAESAGAITLFQVVEHLPFPVLVDVLVECTRVLRPGGLLIAETPNAQNLQVAATNFWLDPSHQRPLHPQLLQFLATHVGFTKVDGLYLNDLGQGRQDLSNDPTGQEIRRLGQLIDGPGDFSLLAWR